MLLDGLISIIRSTANRPFVTQTLSYEIINVFDSILVDFIIISVCHTSYTLPHTPLQMLTNRKRKTSSRGKSLLSCRSESKITFTMINKISSCLRRVQLRIEKNTCQADHQANMIAMFIHWLWNWKCKVLWLVIGFSKNYYSILDSGRNGKDCNSSEAQSNAATDNESDHRSETGESFTQTNNEVSLAIIEVTKKVVPWESFQKPNHFSCNGQLDSWVR